MSPSRFYFFATPRRALGGDLARKSNFASAFLPLPEFFFVLRVARSVDTRETDREAAAEIRIGVKSQVLHRGRERVEARRNCRAEGLITSNGNSHVKFITLGERAGERSILRVIRAATPTFFSFIFPIASPNGRIIPRPRRNERFVRFLEFLQRLLSSLHVRLLKFSLRGLGLYRLRRRRRHYHQRLNYACEINDGRFRSSIIVVCENFVCPLD